MISAKWFQFFRGDQPERDKLEEAIRHSTIALEIMTKHLEKELDALTNRPEADFTLPSWAYKQAYQNGQIKTLRDLLTMTRMEQR